MLGGPGKEREGAGAEGSFVRDKFSFTEHESRAAPILVQRTRSRDYAVTAVKIRSQCPNAGARGRAGCSWLPEEILVQWLEVEHAGDQDAAKVPSGIAVALPVLRGPQRRHLRLLPAGDFALDGKS